MNSIVWFESKEERRFYVRILAISQQEQKRYQLRGVLLAEEAPEFFQQEYPELNRRPFSEASSVTPDMIDFECMFNVYNRTGTFVVLK